MKHRPIVFIDVETVGGPARKSNVIDIGAIRVENGKVVKTMNHLVNPEQPIPSFITRLTGITNDMIWAAPSFTSIAQELEEILDGAVFAAHHVDFDYGFIKEEFRRVGVRFNHDRMCTVKLSRLLYPAQKRHSLDAIISNMNYAVTNRHRGFDDAEVISKYFITHYQEDQVGMIQHMSKITVYKRARLRCDANQMLLGLK